MSSGVSRRVGMLDDVAPTLDALARATAGGLTLVQALTALPGGDRRLFAARLRAAVVDQRTGQPVARVLRAQLASDWARAAECQLALTVLVLLAELGGSAPLALDRAAAAVRERRGAIAERRAQAAQARWSAALLSVVPLVFSLWGITSDPRSASFLLHSRTGAVCMGAGMTLNALGWWWMHRITMVRT